MASVGDLGSRSWAMLGFSLMWLERHYPHEFVAAMRAAASGAMTGAAAADLMDRYADARERGQGIYSSGIFYWLDRQRARLLAEEAGR